MNYSGKNVFVTGGAGFIGSTLVRKLLAENANVIVYDNFVSGSRQNLKEIQNDIKIIKGDILNKNLGNVIQKNNVDFLFNLAALPYIPDCYDKPAAFFDICAKGTLQVMLAAKEANVKRIIQYSSSEVYGTAKKAPMDEKHPTLPLSTYAVSKLAADRLCYTLHHEQNIPIIILRQFNTYGPRETHPYIIPELIRQLAKNDKIKLGNTKARRDLLYVDDAARAAISLMKEKKAEGEVFNCGYGKDYSVEELAHKIGNKIGHKNIKIKVEKTRLRPLDVQKLQANYKKLNNLTGWKPKIDFEKGLELTIDWFYQNGKKWPWKSYMYKK